MKKLIFKILPILLGLNAVIVFSQAYTWMPLGSGSSNGTNGNTYAAALFNGKLVCGGSFTVAGGVNVNNIAAYDPVTEQWSALGNGVNGEIKALFVYSGFLYAGGQFSSPGNNIARWDGNTWQNCGSGTNGEVNAFLLYNGEIVVGGDFSNAGGNNTYNIARYNGVSWGTYASGLGTGSGGDRVNALAIHNSQLVAGGDFLIGSANNVARWNGSAWSPYNNDDFEDRVQALKSHAGALYVGGRFEGVGSVPNTKYICKWNGSAWQNVGNGLDDGDVEALEVFKNTLIVGGNFRETGTGLYVDRIAEWTGTEWKRMLTGMNDRVNALYTVNYTDTILYAAGEFTSAGGKWVNYTAQWGSFTTSSVSGTVRHEGTNNPATGGMVKAVRYDVVTREVIVIDSAAIQPGGLYNLSRVPKMDPDVRVIVFPDDEDSFIDTGFVPTYYPSALTWFDATVVVPVNNLTNINITVKNRNTGDSHISSGNLRSVVGISGNVFLNIILPPVGSTSVPYWKNSVVYIEQNGGIVAFAESNDQQQYSIGGLSAGTYTMRVTRLGYEVETRQVIVSASNLTENFYLDTQNAIGITNISTVVPKEHSLMQNYPNPFNPLTNIEFAIPAKGFASLKIYNILGKEVATLVNEDLRAGIYRVDFNAANLPSGVYFYRLQTASFTETRRMVLVK